MFFILLTLLLLGGYGLAARRPKPFAEPREGGSHSPATPAAQFSDLERLMVLAAGLSYWNHSAWIVTANVGRYTRTGKLDVDYLERLAQKSPDAIPTLIGALASLAPADAVRVRESLRHASADRSILIPPPGRGDLSWYE